MNLFVVEHGFLGSFFSFVFLFLCDFFLSLKDYFVESPSSIFVRMEGS